MSEGGGMVSTADTTVRRVSSPSYSPSEPFWTICTLQLLPGMALMASGRGSLHGELWNLQYLLAQTALAVLLV